MVKEFNQLAWDEHVQADLRQLLQLAVREDSEEASDWTTAALVPEEAVGRAVVADNQPRKSFYEENEMEYAHSGQSRA